MQAYVKFVEHSGAIAVPLCWDWDEYTTRQLMSQLNGILIPGGDQDLISPKDELTTF
jgi:gamma-glutamyl-gamma-aminobutyrate hydrolase PuuD